MNSSKLFLKPLLVSLLALFLLPQTSLAQEASQEASIDIEPVYSYRSYTIEDGLPDNTINAILQDDEGFIWVGTNDGVARFDGYDFVVHRRGDATESGILGNAVQAIYEDEMGVLWVGAIPGGISRLNGQTQRFEAVGVAGEGGRPEGRRPEGGPPEGGPPEGGPPEGGPPEGGPPEDGPTTDNAIPPEGNAFFERWLRSGRLVVNAIFVDESQVHWIGGPPGSGLVQYNVETDEVNRVPDDNYAGDSVSDIWGDRSGGIWLLTTTGVTRYFDGEYTTYVEGLDSTTRTAANLAESETGEIWLTFSDTLYRFDETANQLIEVGEAPSTAGKMVFDGDGVLWVATGDGLYTVVPETGQWTQFVDLYQTLGLGRGNETLTALYTDREDNIWLGTESGLFVLPRRHVRFESFATQAAEADGRVSDAVRAMSGFGQAAWMAFGSGVGRFDAVSEAWEFYQMPEGQRPFSTGVLEASAAGGVWMGLSPGVGLRYFDPLTQEFRAYPLEPASAPLPPFGGVDSMTETGDGYLWLIVLRNSLRRIDIETGEEKIYSWPSPGAQLVDHDEDPFELRTLGLSTMLVDNGRLWVMRGFQVDIYDLQTYELLRSIPFDDGPAAAGVIEVHETADGEVWLSSAQTLLRYILSTEELIVYTNQNGLSASTIYRIEEDETGDLWLSSNNGLMHFDKERERFTSFDTRDGLLNSSFEAEASWQAGDGRIYFGTQEGFITFTPDQISPDPPVTQPLLTEMRLFNEPVTVDSWSLLNGAPLLSESIETVDSITLDHTEDLVSFAFSSLSFGSPEKNRYRYRLLGLEQDWNEVESDRRFASYTHLDGGTYTLEVQGSNADGVWSEDTASLELVILPPWWETLWFRAAMVLALAALIFGGVRWRLNEMELRNQALTAEVARQTAVIYEAEEQKRRLAVLEERQQIGRELHDDLGQVIGYVGMQTLAALNRLRRSEYQQTEDTLQQLMRVAQDAHTDIRQYILGIRQDNNEAPESFTEQIKGYLQSLEELYGLRVTLSLPPNWDDEVLSRDMETQLMRIVQESLNNTRKYAEVEDASVWFSLTGTELLVIISDEGKGFDLEGRQKGGGRDGHESPHFGLMIMQERAESFGGEFEIRSTVGSGTQVLVRVPLQAGVDPEAAVAGLRVLLVDDHRLYAEGISNLLLTRGVNIVGVAENGLEAQKMAAERQPDLILMDVEMPVCDGLEATRLIKQAHPDIKVVMLTVAADEQKLYKALQYGASGYLLKNVSGREFFQMLADAMSGANVLPPSLAARLLNGFIEAAQETSDVTVTTTEPEGEPAEEKPAVEAEVAKPVLTYRQQQVLELVVQGMSNRQIAEQLFISEHTVKLHVSRILRMFQLKSRYELAQHPANRGLE